MPSAILMVPSVTIKGTTRNALISAPVDESGPDIRCTKRPEQTRLAKKPSRRHQASTVAHSADAVVIIGCIDLRAGTASALCATVLAVSA